MSETGPVPISMKLGQNIPPSERKIFAQAISPADPYFTSNRIFFEINEIAITRDGEGLQSAPTTRWKALGESISKKL